MVEAGEEEAGVEALNFESLVDFGLRRTGSGDVPADDAEGDASSAKRDSMSPSSSSGTASGMYTSESSSSSTTFRLLFEPNNKLNS